MSDEKVIINKNNLEIVKRVGNVGVYSNKNETDSNYYITTVEVHMNGEDCFSCIKFNNIEDALEKAYKKDISLSAEYYIYRCQMWLISEHGDFKGKSTVINTEEVLDNKKDRDNLIKEIENNEYVDKAHWEDPDYGCTLWIQFK